MVVTNEEVVKKLVTLYHSEVDCGVCNKSLDLITELVHGLGGKIPADIEDHKYDDPRTDLEIQAAAANG